MLDFSEEIAGTDAVQVVRDEGAPREEIYIVRGQERVEISWNRQVDVWDLAYFHLLHGYWATDFTDKESEVRAIVATFARDPFFMPDGSHEY